MSAIAYVDGAYLPADQASVSIFDRGLLFADSVYEVTTVLEGRLIDNRRHLARLVRSLQALEIPMPMPQAEIIAMQESLIERNAVREGVVYLQVTRGVAERSFEAPIQPSPTVFAFASAKNIIDAPQAREGISVITVPDQRWKRRDIKTTGLLAQSLAKTEASRRGAEDAWMVEDGMVTEGSSNNAWIVRGDGIVQTRPTGTEILGGITRAALFDIAEAAGYRIEERPFSLSDARNAAEAFVSSASTFVWPVVAIDGHKLGDGRPGPLTRDLRHRYIEAARAGVLG